MGAIAGPTDPVKGQRDKKMCIAVPSQFRHQLPQLAGVVHGVARDGVVEKYPHFLAVEQPVFYHEGVPFQPLVGVGRGVQLFVAVQPQVGRVGGGYFQAREPLAGAGNHESNGVVAQQVEGLLAEPAQGDPT